MNTADRLRALIELGDQTVRTAAQVEQAWQSVKASARSPVALDRFALQAGAIANALGQLSERATQLAGDLLDGED